MNRDKMLLLYSLIKHIICSSIIFLVISLPYGSRIHAQTISGVFVPQLSALDSVMKVTMNEFGLTSGVLAVYSPKSTGQNEGFCHRQRLVI